MLYLLSENFISRNGPPEERGGCESGRKELKWQRAGAYRESQRGRVKQDCSFIPCNWKTGAAETERPSGPNFEPCAAEALKSMAATLPWMPTITQMAYLENGVGHLTASRDGADSDQTPPPNSMILAVYFWTSDRAENGPPRPSATEPSVGFKLGTRNSKGAPNQTDGWAPSKQKPFPTQTT